MSYIIEAFKATFYTRGEFERHWGQYFQDSEVLKRTECEVCGTEWFTFLSIGAKISTGAFGIPYMEYAPICSEACFNLWLLRCTL